MATKKQKLAAKKNRANAIAAMKKAKTPAAKAKHKAKAVALAKIMKSKTTAKPTTAGSAKHALAKVARTEANKTRAAAVEKMKGLKPKSKAWQKAKRNVVTASSNVRKSGNVMRDVSGREMGQSTSYTGPREAMRRYIKSIEDSKGGKGLTKLGDKTEFTKVNQLMLSEMEGDTYAQKRASWDRAWGDPGSDKYRAMQDKQADRHSKMINDPNYDPDFVPKIFDNVPDADVKTPGTGTAGPRVVGTADGGPYREDGTGEGFGRDRLAARGGYAPGFFGGNPGVLNYATPGFLGSEALNPYFSNYENWSQFMPTNYSLAQQGGALYQPGQYWGGARAGLYGTGGVGPVSGGTGPGGGGYYPPGGGGGTYPPGGGVTYTPPPGSTYRPPGTTPGGSKYPGVIPGSQKEQDLDAGRTHHPEMYDQNDMWVGAEGGGREGAGLGADVNRGGNAGMTQGGGGWNNPNYSAGYDSTMGPGAGTRVEWDTSPTAGLLNTQIFDDDPTYWHELTDAQKMQSYADRQNTLDQHKQAVNYMDTGITYGTQANQPTTTTTGYNKQNQMANQMAANQAAAAQQAAYAASLDDEAMRAWNSMSQAQQAAASTGYGEGGGFMGADIGHDEGGYTGGDFSSGEGWE